jgi:hypothetical protein
MDSGEPGFPRGYDGHRREQARMGLRLTPAQRLRWLEETMDSMRRWRGLARPGRPPSDTEGERRDPR